MCTKNGSYCEKEKKVRGGGHSRCKWGSEAFVKFKKKNSRGGGGGVRLGEGGGGCQSGCEGRSDAFLKSIFFLWGGGVDLGVRVEVIREVKLLWKFEKNQGLGRGWR